MAETGGGKMGVNATWSMAVGGMVGGGIFSVLGIVIGRAGPLAWLSFLIGGVIALATAWSYARLTRQSGRSGGAFTFLRDAGRSGTAGTVAWVLVAGYILTVAVYAFTFGHYLAAVARLGDLAARILTVAIVVLFIVLNVRAVGQSTRAEIAIVWTKLAVLIGLAVVGLAHWAPARVGEGGPPPSIGGLVLGAAAIFMAYQGFEMLTYEVREIEDPRRTLRLGMLSAVAAVMALYIAVTLGATMLAGPAELVAQRDTALAAAGEHAAGEAGIILISMAAALSTAAAINATIFSTARLVRTMANEHEFPRAAARTNHLDAPWIAVLFVGVAGAALGAIGSLDLLLQVTSLVFLGTFTIVNALAVLRLRDRRWIGAIGAAGAAIASGLLIVDLARTAPLVLVAMAAVVAIAAVGRPRLIRAAEQIDAAVTASEAPRARSAAE